MSKIRINSISIENYRSFGEQQDFVFPNKNYKKPVSIIGYNNAGKSNLLDCILYGVGQKFINQQSFNLSDFHNRNWDNIPYISSNIEANVVGQNSWGKDISMNGIHTTGITVDDNQIIEAKISPSFFGADKYYNIFYINFHNIKEEIVTQKTSWGNLKSFLGKHIQKIVESDVLMADKKEAFEEQITKSTNDILEGSELNKFIDLIRKNYITNLRNDDCTVDFGLPNYEDIFLKMMFKIGLNGSKENLVPIDHFGDGYISMFVMAVIQAIAESNTTDECLFLFEEPESFLHENHQEYFYKTVLCGLAQKGHQVIYTTHSDKMLDPFDTKGLIRLEMDKNNQTIKKYNDVGEFNYEEVDEETGEVINFNRYNEFIKTIEPNLSRMLFSKKVILVEGPNDVLVYKYAIKQKVLAFIEDNETIINKEQYADTYMNFENISIICHHGKGTANYIIELCKHFKIDYLVVNDWDFDTDFIDKVILDFDDLKKDEIWESILQETNKNGEVHSETTLKKMIKTNKNLLLNSGVENIHFNVKKLETVIGYESDNKSSIAIWELINSSDFNFDENLFPEKLERFIGIIHESVESEEQDDSPF
jgi:predicted ATP-dependent endonuclease of OLD family